MRLEWADETHHTSVQPRRHCACRDRRDRHREGPRRAVRARVLQAARSHCSAASTEALIWARKRPARPALKPAAYNRPRALPLDRATTASRSPCRARSRSRRARRRRAAGRSSPGRTARPASPTCARPRATRDEPARGYATSTRCSTRWLKAGYAVVRTDYQGLGTPGTHPYLVGQRRGPQRARHRARRAPARHARSASASIIAGHSQGGHAALWAAALAPKWTPELKVRGTVAFAPASHIERAGRAVDGAQHARAGLSGLGRADLPRRRHGRSVARRPVAALARRRGALPADAHQVPRRAEQARTRSAASPPAQLLRHGTDRTPLLTELGEERPAAT